MSTARCCCCNYTQKAQLQQRDRASARRAMLVNSCYVSPAVGVIKVSNSKSDLQVHSGALAMVPFDRPHTNSYYSSIANMSLSCTVSEILSLISQHLMRSRDSERIPFGSNKICNILYVHSYSSVSTSTRNLKRPASPVTVTASNQSIHQSICSTKCCRISQ